MLSFRPLLIYFYLVNSAEIALGVGEGIPSLDQNQEARPLGAAVSYYWGPFGISALGLTLLGKVRSFSGLTYRDLVRL